MIWLGLFLIVLILWGTAVYNRLITLKNHVLASWGNVDVRLRERYDLIPNIVETVRGYARHESEVLERVTRLRGRYLRGRSPDDMIRADRAMSGALRLLFAYVEAYPDLKASVQFLALQSALGRIETEIAFSREVYNDRVLAYNTAREIVPDATIAAMFDFRPSEFSRAEP